VRVQRAKVKRIRLDTLLDQEIISPRTGARMVIRQLPDEHDDELTVMRLLKPGQRWTPEHVHLDFSERFEVLSGIADAKHAGKKLRLGVGEVHHVGKGVRHVNLRNNDITDLLYLQTFAPATEGARGYVSTLAQVLRDGRDQDGELPWPLVLAIGDVTRERTYARRVPYLLQRKALLPLGSYVAGTLGHRVQLARKPRKAETPTGELSAQGGGDLRGAA
jgi:mannose-6-phosphate isomerase-like protein (cupin superfamily)